MANGIHSPVDGSTSSTSPKGVRRPREVGTGCSRCLVDYRSKQANLSANALLRLQALVEGTRQPRDTDPLQLLQQEDEEQFESFEDSTSTTNESPSLPQEPQSTDPLSVSQQPPNSSSNSLHGNGSEHSINLDKVFESKHQHEPHALNILNCITVILSDECEKIQFSLRNPEAAQRRTPTQPPQRPKGNAPTINNSKKRTIKCVVPHDRFQLPPQVQMPALPQQPRLSNAATSVTIASHHKLQCIEEANEDVSEVGLRERFMMSGNRLFASRVSVNSSTSSFAMDSYDTDEEEMEKLLQPPPNLPPLDARIQKGEEEHEDEAEPEPEPPQQSPDDDRSESDQSEEEADSENDEDDETHDADTDVGSVYAGGDGMRYSLAESTLAGTLSGLLPDLTEVEEMDLTETDLGYGVYHIHDSRHSQDESHTEHHDDDDNSESQSEAGLDESETDGGYDGDDTEAALSVGDANSTAPEPAPLLDNSEVEESSSEEYEEDMEDEAETVAPAAAEEEVDEEELRDELEVVEAEPVDDVPVSDAESEREGAEQVETDGEESLMTNGTEDSSQNNAMSYGLSVYLSTHSRGGNTSAGIVKKNNYNDSVTATSVTGSLTLDSSNQSSVITNSTHGTGATNFTQATGSSNGSRGSRRSLLTTRTTRSAPSTLLRQDSSDSLQSTKSELDESGHSRSSACMADFSRASTRASSAPNEDSFCHRRKRYSKLLSGDSRPADASSESNLSNSGVDADDSTVGSGVDHRRRRHLSKQKSADFGKSSRMHYSRSGSARGSNLMPAGSTIIPRSNTPQGALLRTRTGEGVSRRPSLKGDAQPMLPPRTLSRESSDGSSIAASSRTTPRRGHSLLGASSNTNDMDRSRTHSRPGVGRTKSRESFMGGSRIKKWDSSTANRSGQGLSLLERHLNEGGKRAGKRQSSRRSTLSKKQTSNDEGSLPSLAAQLSGRPSMSKGNSKGHVMTMEDKSLSSLAMALGRRPSMGGKSHSKNRMTLEDRSLSSLALALAR